MNRQSIDSRHGLVQSLPKGRRRRVTMFPEVTPAGFELAALLASQPGKSMDDLIADGTVTQDTRSVFIDETVITVRSQITYDTLNRASSYVDATLNPDFSQIESDVAVISKLHPTRSHSGAARWARSSPSDRRCTR